MARIGLHPSLIDRLAIKVARDHSRARIARLKKISRYGYAGRLLREYVAGDQQQPRRRNQSPTGDHHSASALLTYKSALISHGYADCPRIWPFYCGHSLTSIVRGRVCWRVESQAGSRIDGWGTTLSPRRADEGQSSPMCVMALSVVSPRCSDTSGVGGEAEHATDVTQSRRVTPERRFRNVCSCAAIRGEADINSA